MHTPPFLLENCETQPALLDDATDNWMTYAELRKLASDWADAVAADSKQLIFLYAHNDIATVGALLGCLMAGHAVALFDPQLPLTTQQDLEQLYQPEQTINTQAGTPHAKFNRGNAPIDPELAILLSTSGSTGSPKLVRLTLESLEANAAGIAEVLASQSEDVAAGHLPLHYSFGLSVLTSHLVRGARIVLTSRGMTDRAFWSVMRAADVTHLPGVPFHFKMMERLGYKRLGLRSLSVMAQAGGFLDVESRTRAFRHMEEAGGRFYVLYGQTETAPRMTTLQHDQFQSAPCSVGTPLPGCTLDIANPDENGVGEVRFSGPNVMKGYAECRADLALGDTKNGMILTGDVGVLDDAGRLTLVGRTTRFAKVYGLRVSMDEIERFASTYYQSAVVQNGEQLHIFCLSPVEAENTRIADELLVGLLSRFSIPRSGYRIQFIGDMPTTPRGKVDYEALKALL